MENEIKFADNSTYNVAENKWYEPEQKEDNLMDDDIPTARSTSFAFNQEEEFDKARDAFLQLRIIKMRLDCKMKVSENLDLKQF